MARRGRRWNRTRREAYPRWLGYRRARKLANRLPRYCGVISTTAPGCATRRGRSSGKRWIVRVGQPAQVLDHLPGIQPPQDVPIQRLVFLAGHLQHRGGGIERAIHPKTGRGAARRPAGNKSAPCVPESNGKKWGCCMIRGMPRPRRRRTGGNGARNPLPDRNLSGRLGLGAAGMVRAGGWLPR